MMPPPIGLTRHEWGTALTGFGRPFGIGFDAAGLLHVTDMDLHLVARFDARLEAVQWHDGGPGGWSGAAPLAEGELAAAPARTPGAWNGPHSFACHPDGRSFVTCYYDAAIHRLSASGKPEARIADGVITGPASAILDGPDHLLVAEYRQNRILRLDTDGRVAMELAGTFDRPHMAMRLPDASIIVADTWHDRVQKFAPDGQLIDAAWLRVPGPVAVDAAPGGGVLVTSWGDHAVLSFDQSGRSQGRLVVPPLQRPYDARFMTSRIAVADSHHSRVLIVDAPRFAA